MVLPGFLYSGDRPPEPIVITHESQIDCMPADLAELRELNDAVDLLSRVFPDVPYRTIRDKLEGFSGESQLQLVASVLIKESQKRAVATSLFPDGVPKSKKARRKNAESKEKEKEKQKDKKLPVSSRSKEYERGEGFRTEEYKDAVALILCEEFYGFGKDTIALALEEHNWRFSTARTALMETTSKTWRYTFRNLFTNKKPHLINDPRSHPLLVWKRNTEGVPVPGIRATGSPELDLELFSTLVRPILDYDRSQQEERDRKVATAVNEAEAEAADAMYECQCCFIDAAFEDFAQCSESHLICKRCVRHSLSEALFGGTFQRNVDADHGTLRCVASGAECCGTVSAEHLQRSLREERGGFEMLRKLEQRLAASCTALCDLPLVKCPFCDYAEVDEVYLPKGEDKLIMRRSVAWNIFAILFTLIGISQISPAIALTVFTLFVTHYARHTKEFHQDWRRARHRHFRRECSLRFRCKSDECGKISCLSCYKLWVDPHVCHEPSLFALRIQVETAKSNAIKRVCPRCSTAFVKNGGCNKLVCVCGYKMCYMCRADVCRDGYQHFCDHFRIQGDGSRCLACSRCNLWESEDVDKLLKRVEAEETAKWKSIEDENRDALHKANTSPGKEDEKHKEVRRWLQAWAMDVFIEMIYS